MRYFLLVLFSFELMALSIDPLLLKAQASVFPKVMLLDSEIAKKSYENKLVLSVVYSNDEKMAAHEFKEMIDTEYVSRLGNYVFDVRLVNIHDFDKTAEASAYYLFSASSQEKRKVIAEARQKQRICFGYDYNDFQHNVLLSLFVKEKVYIYLNKSALHEYSLKFAPVFYRIPKVVK